MLLFKSNEKLCDTDCKLSNTLVNYNLGDILMARDRSLKYLHQLECFFKKM